MTACPVVPGKVIGERYTVELLIGEGSFGWVFTAIDSAAVPAQRVAMKFLRPEHAKSPVTLYRFQNRELALLLRVEQAGPAPNVVRAIDSQLYMHQGLPFILLEFIDGPSLCERLERQPRCSQDESARIGLGMARGLAALHACGIVHRDLKPANVRLRHGTEPVIVDLGIAAVEDVTAGLTLTGQAPMTPRYAAPEQLAGKRVDARSDIYALGIILEEMGVSGRLERIARQCLEREPSLRPSASHVAAAIQQVLWDTSRLRAAMSHTAYLIVLAAGMLGLVSDRMVPEHHSHWMPVASMSHGRVGHTATKLPNGQVLVVGGYDMKARRFIESAERYDPNLDQWFPAGALSPRKLHTAMPLPNGDVLVLGGVGRDEWISEVWKYLSSSNTWASAAPIGTPRIRFTATWLPPVGRILIAGGRDKSGTARSEAELFEPQENRWTAAAPMLTTRTEHVAVWISGIEKLLVAGGSNEEGFSLPTAELYDPIQNAWSVVEPMKTPRDRCTATLLADGKVLVVGGMNRGTVLASTEMYNPRTGQWSTVAPMHAPRHQHTATLLDDGRVLVLNSAGGAEAEIYDPLSNQWILNGTPDRQRADPTATLLADGRVLVAGGSSDQNTDACDVFDPRGDVESPRPPILNYAQWVPAKPMEVDRYDHTMTLLPDGRVLVVGAPSRTYFNIAEVYDPRTDTWASPIAMTAVPPGRYAPTGNVLPSSGEVLIAGGGMPDGIHRSTERFIPGQDAFVAAAEMNSYRHQHTTTVLQNGELFAVGGYGAGFHADAERYDPVKNSWTPAATMRGPRTRHAAVLLSDGRVLVAGGADGNHAILDSSEIYYPSSNQWSLGPQLNTPRYGGTALLLSDGRVVLAGGSGLEGRAIGLEIYDPSIGRWKTATPMHAGRNEYLAIALPNGKVLVAGGKRGDVFLNSAEIYDPKTNSWTNTAPLQSARSNAAALVLPDGRIFVTGGLRDGTPLVSAEIYEP